jgi:NADH-quinone oxidoreductase subunit A
VHSISIIVIIGFLSVFTAITLLILAYFQCPNQDNELKNIPFDFGMPATEESKSDISVSFANFAIVFIVLATEMILLIPFAIAFSRLKLFALGHGIVFLFIMALTIFYANQKNLLRLK